MNLHVFEVDQDCDLTGSLILDSNGALDTSHDASPMTIWGGDVQLDETSSSITVSPYGTLTFSERCESGESVGIASTSERMSFTLAELDRVTAADISFDSFYGRMTSYGIDHPNTNMQNVHQDVYLVANGSSGFLTFTDSESNFRQMRGWGRNGITMSNGADLSTRNGDLELNFPNGDFNMKAVGSAGLVGSTNIIARFGNLILNSNVGTIYAEATSLMEASNGSFSLSRPMEITRKNNAFQLASKFTIRTMHEFSCNAPIWLVDRSPYFISTPTETLVEIEAGTISLNDGCQLNATDVDDEIYFRPSCYGGNCSMYLGSISAPNTFHLLDAELDRVTTDGTLRFGDRDGEDNYVDNIYVQDLSYKWAPIGVYLTAAHAASDATLIEFSGENNLTSQLTVESRKNVRLTGKVEVSSTITITANSDCDVQAPDGGGFEITSNGSLWSIVNEPVYITAGAMEVGGPLSAGTGSLTITEACNDNQSIGIGGTGFEPPELMSLKTSELDYLEANNLYIHSTLGSIWVYGVEHPFQDMQNVKEGVFISADNVDGREVTFLRENSTFRRLNVSSYGAINIEEDLSSVDGDIMLKYYEGQLNISQDVDINAEGGDVSIHTMDSDLFVESSFSIVSEHEDINLVTNLIIKRDPVNSTIIRFMSNLTFSCHATIRLTGPPPPPPHVTLIYIEVGQIDMYSNCTIEADKPNDIIHLRPSCSDVNCDMYFGAGTNAPTDAFHLTDDEFNRISTKGYMYIGDRDSDDVDRIYFDGVDYKSANSGISISALEEDGGAVEFVNNPVYFEYGLNVFTTGDIIVNTSFTSIVYDTRMTYNKNCLRDGRLMLKPGASISTIGGGSDLYIFGSYFDIDPSANVTVGNADIFITETCETSTSIVLGREANHLTGVMTLDYGELETLTASDIRFTSDLGHIQIYHLDQAMNMSDVTETVTLQTRTTYGSIRFTDDYSNFHTLYVNSSGPIYVEVDVFTYSGPMEFNFEDGDMYMNATVDIVADGGDLVITSLGSSLHAISPGSLWSKNDSFSLTRPMTITRHPTHTSLFKIQTGDLFHCDTTITKIGAASNDSLLQIRAGEISLDENCVITADSAVDEIYLRPDCEGPGCYIALGESSFFITHRFYLTDSELDRVISQGKLTIGDRNFSTDVEKIHIDGISLGHAPLGTIFEASYDSAEIGIYGNLSFVRYMFEIRSSGDIELDATLVGEDTVKIAVDSDCQNGGTWMITNLGELDTSDTTLHFWGGSIEIDEEDGVINSGSANMKLSERCTSGWDSFGLGGDSQPSETMALSRRELDRITAHHIYFESWQGSVTSYGFLHPEITMSNVSGSVHLWANDSAGQIKFTYSPSTFRELQAVGENGIFVEEDVTTTVGELQMKFWRNSLIIGADVDLIANGDLVFNSLAETVYITLPASLQSLTGNFYSYRPMEITRNTNSTFTMWIYDQFDCTAPIEFVDPLSPTSSPIVQPSASPSLSPSFSPTLR